ncbi:MAG: PD-(D/E)XK nuclease family protein, partial [Thiotrichales bacterium]|nr:PD-(D/E)XK nuclease family protein [Thiotrichales bacterium]
VLLNSHQEQVLWRRVINESRAGEALINKPGAVRQVRESYRICKAWHITVFPNDIYLNEDAYQFRRWVESYERLLHTNAWLDLAGLPDHLADNIRSVTQEALPGNIAFYGFEESTPQQRSLLTAVQESIGNVREIKARTGSAQITISNAPDSATELEQAACWARACLARIPEARIGIIVSRLDQVRDRVEAVFTRELCPEHLVGARGTTLPFVISQGRPLFDYPLVMAAMNILTLMQHDITINRLGLILKSPFICGYSAEHNQRARLDLRLRKLRVRRTSAQHLVRMMGNPRIGDECPLLLKCLQGFQDHLQEMPTRLLPGEWIVKFSELLNIMGWPGDAQPGSDEYQVLLAWKKALDNLLSLDLVSTAMDAGSARASLYRILAETTFQPETAEVPVTITGVDGSAAMEFDQLWITGLHDQAWPPGTQAHPYIPVSLQRAAGIPSAQADTQLDYYGRRLEQLLNSASGVVLSYPATDKDSELRPSPLLAEYRSTAGQHSKEDAGSRYYRQWIGSADCEWFEDDRAPVIASGQSVMGGAGIFRDQALCPFRACARHRLHAAEIDRIDLGLDAGERGSLVHRVLQLLWQKLKDSSRLRTSSASALQAAIAQAIDRGIHEYIKGDAINLSGRFRQLEAQRLTRLVTNWLQFELERPDFTVLATEKGHHVNFAGITLGIRLDRMDQLQDGRLVIIDYKTGSANPADWDGERPSEPQLPLYAVTCEGDVAALVFARLKPGDMSYSGLAQEDDLIPGGIMVADDWSNRLLSWRQNLTGLGEEFINGVADVAPKDEKSCRACELHSLCRIHEKVMNATHGEEG